MLSDVVGKAVVVLFLVFRKVEWGGGPLSEEEIHHGGIVETTMEIGAHTVTVGNATVGGAVGLDSQRFVCAFVYRGGYALMDFIASHLQSILAHVITISCKRKLRLACDFLFAHDSAHRQQTDAFDVDGVALRLLRVVNAHAQHLITAADAEDGFSSSVGFLYSVSHSLFFQMAQVVDGGLATWQDDDVGPEQLLFLRSVIYVEAMVLLNGVEVGEIAQMSQFHHCNVDLAVLGESLFLVEPNPVLVFHADIIKERHYTKDGHLA